MRTRPLWVSVLIAIATLGPVPANAGSADPAYSHVDRVLVGDAGGGAGLGFLVIIRDDATQTLPERPVTIQFLDPSVVLLDFHLEGEILDCATRTMEKLSGWDGETVFHPRFGGGSPSGLVEVRSKGVLLARVPFRSTDIDGSGATDLADLGRFAEALFASSFEAHCDYSLDGVVNIADLDILRRDLFYGTPGASCP